MLGAIIAILGGLIAASSLIVAKKPNAKELLDKLAPFQGIIGVILLVWSVLGLLSVLKAFSIIGIAVVAVEFIVGFLLAYSLLSKYLFSKSDTAREKGQALRLKLAKYQVPAGVILIVLGVLSLIL